MMTKINIQVIIKYYVRQLDNCVHHMDTTNMSKQTTLSSVMTFVPIEDEGYSLKHKRNTVIQQKVPDTLAMFFKTVPRVKYSSTENIALHNRRYTT